MEGDEGGFVVGDGGVEVTEDCVLCVVVVVMVVVVDGSLGRLGVIGGTTMGIVVF